MIFNVYALIVFCAGVATAQSSEITDSPATTISTPIKIQWMLAENRNCDNCSLAENFRCWDGFPFNHVFVCLYATIDPNERLVHRTGCDQCNVLGQILVSAHRTESCVRQVIQNQKALSSMPQTDTSNVVMQWFDANLVFISVVLQASILCVVSVLLVRSFCAKKPTNFVTPRPPIHKKYVYHLSGQTTMSQPPHFQQQQQMGTMTEGHYATAS